MAIEYSSIDGAFRAFACARGTEDQEHIKPLHRHIALRLVLEGGFLPDEVTPHPPVRASHRSGQWLLEYDTEAETVSELTVFGGMKTKQIDVVVAKDGIGPVVAISVKGTCGAYRNLVNRMEEAIGDSTNIHVMYPGLVYGFLHILRANREASGYNSRDMGITREGEVSPLIKRYYAALSEMTGRKYVRNDYTRYESVALALLENDPKKAGAVFPDFPSPDSALRIERFFSRLYEIYDLRFPSRAEHVAKAYRVEWSAESELFSKIAGAKGASLEDVIGYAPRLSD